MTMYCNTLTAACDAPPGDALPDLPKRCFVWWIPRPRAVCSPGWDTHVVVRRRDLEVLFAVTEPRDPAFIQHPSVLRLIRAAGLEPIAPTPENDGR